MEDTRVRVAGGMEGWEDEAWGMGVYPLVSYDSRTVHGDFTRPNNA